MAFKRRSIPIAPLTNGVTTVVSDKANAEFKTLSDIEQDIILGGMTSRRGININSIYSGGSEPSILLPTYDFNIPTYNEEIESPLFRETNQYVGLLTGNGWQTGTEHPFLCGYIGNSSLPLAYDGTMFYKSFTLKNAKYWGSLGGNNQATIKLSIIKATSETQINDDPFTPGSVIWSKEVNIFDLFNTLPEYTPVDIVFDGIPQTTISVDEYYFFQFDFLNFDTPMGTTNIEPNQFLMPTILSTSTSSQVNASLLYKNVGDTALNLGKINAEGIYLIGERYQNQNGVIDDCIAISDNKNSVTILTTDSDDSLTLNKKLTETTIEDITPTDIEFYNERYGFDTVYDSGSGTTFHAFLSTLLQCGEVTEEDTKGSVLFFNPKWSSKSQPLRVIAPTSQSVFSTVGTQVTGYNYAEVWYGTSQPYAAGYHKYAYSFEYVNGSTSDIIESFLVDAFGGTSSPSNDLYSQILHLQRRPTETNSLEVVAIKLYRKTVISISTNGASDAQNRIEDAEYRLIATIEGDALDERETGDDISDNYVRYEDRSISLDANSDDSGFTREYYDRFLTVLIDSTSYFPKGSSLAIYNDRLMVGGDTTAKNLLFFSEDTLFDFPSDNSLVVPLVDGDDYITAMGVLGDNLYVFSEYGTYRTAETSTSAPFYTVDRVENMDGIGCIAPKSLIKKFGRFYFLSAEGYVEFNGTEFKILTSGIEFMNQINLNHINDTGANVDDPLKVASWYPSFYSSAYYNPDDTSIYLSLPLDSDSGITKVYKYYLKKNKWSETTIDNLLTFIQTVKKQVPTQYIKTNGGLRIINDNDNIDKDTGVDTNIDSVIETYDIDFGEETLFNSIKLWGAGTIDLYIYTRRSTTADFTRENMTLDESGTQTAFNLQGREIRVKIVVKDSENFKMTSSPVVDYSNNGTKRMVDTE